MWEISSRHRCILARTSRGSVRIGGGCRGRWWLIVTKLACCDTDAHGDHLRSIRHDGSRCVSSLSGFAAGPGPAVAVDGVGTELLPGPGVDGPGPARSTARRVGIELLPGPAVDGPGPARSTARRVGIELLPGPVGIELLPGPAVDGPGPEAQKCGCNVGAI